MKSIGFLMMTISTPHPACLSEHSVPYSGSIHLPDYVDYQWSLHGYVVP